MGIASSWALHHHRPLTTHTYTCPTAFPSSVYPRTAWLTKRANPFYPATLAAFKVITCTPISPTIEV